MLAFSTLNFSYVNKWVNIAGFGRTQYTPAGQKSQGSTSNVMLESRVKVISNDDCNEMYGNIDNSQVCAFATGTDTCQVKEKKHYWKILKVPVECISFLNDRAIAVDL